MSCHAQNSWLSRIIIHWNRHMFVGFRWSQLYCNILQAPKRPADHSDPHHWKFYIPSIGYHAYMGREERKDRLQPINKWASKESIYKCQTLMRIPHFSVSFSKSCLSKCQSTGRTNRRPSLLLLERELKFHKEPPRVVIDGVRGVNHFADQSPPLLFWVKVWSSHCSVALGAPAGRRRRSSGTFESPLLLAWV